MLVSQFITLMCVMIYYRSETLLVALHLEFVSTNKQKKPSFEVLVRILTRSHARVFALYLGILKFIPRKQLNYAR